MCQRTIECEFIISFLEFQNIEYTKVSSPAGTAPARDRYARARDARRGVRRWVLTVAHRARDRTRTLAAPYAPTALASVIQRSVDV